MTQKGFLQSDLDQSSAKPPNIWAVRRPTGQLLTPVQIGACRTLRRFAFVPRFFFHLFNDITSIDEEGVELPNAALAMQRAISIAREMAAESVKQGHLVLDHRLEVTGDAGQTVSVVYFRDIVDIKQSASV